MRQGIEAETVNDRVLYLLRTIESGGGDRNRKKRHEAELTRMKEARREHVIVPVTSVFHLNSLTEIVAHMDLQIAKGLRGDSAGHGVDTTSRGARVEERTGWVVGGFGCWCQEAIGSGCCNPNT